MLRESIVLNPFCSHIVYACMHLGDIEDEETYSHVHRSVRRS